MGFRGGGGFGPRGGFGFGRGRGWRCRGFRGGPGVYGRMGPAYSDEPAFLENEAEALRSELESIERRLSELRKSKVE